MMQKKGTYPPIQELGQDARYVDLDGAVKNLVHSASKCAGTSASVCLCSIDGLVVHCIGVIANRVVANRVVNLELDNSTGLEIDKRIASATVTLELTRERFVVLAVKNRENDLTRVIVTSRVSKRGDSTIGVDLRESGLVELVVRALYREIMLNTVPKLTYEHVKSVFGCSSHNS